VGGVHVRIARQTAQLDAVVAFHRDAGLPEIVRFTGHDGYDGVMPVLGPGRRHRHRPRRVPHRARRGHLARL